VGTCDLCKHTCSRRRGAGAYGTPNDAEWDAAAVSLLERGVIHAIAGVRGGGERGQFWYEGGRLMDKNNTFADAVAAAEHLIAVRARRGARPAGRLVARQGHIRAGAPAAATELSAAEHVWRRHHGGQCLARALLRQHGLARCSHCAVRFPGCAG